MSPLNILSADGATLRELRFSNYLEWNGSKYADSQSVEAYTISGPEGSADREIFVVANNIRSPNTMYRLSKNGDILGEYNHFGAAYPIMVKYPGSAREFLVLYGQNDTREPDSLSCPVMIVLDPSKITGKSEAGDSRGFGLPVSNAEEYIVRFPLSDLNHLLLSQGYALSLSVVTQETQARLLFVTGGSYSDPDFMLYRGPGFHFYLDGDFRVVEVNKLMS